MLAPLSPRVKTQWRMSSRSCRSTIYTYVYVICVCMCVCLCMHMGVCLCMHMGVCLQVDDVLHEVGLGLEALLQRRLRH